MFSEDELKKIVSENIEKEEKIGDQIGGSKHQSYVTYKIIRIHRPIEIEKGWEIRYNYELIIETEFTYYPDNPPYTYQKNRVLILQKKP